MKRFAGSNNNIQPASNIVNELGPQRAADYGGLDIVKDSWNSVHLQRHNINKQTYLGRINDHGRGEKVINDVREYIKLRDAKQLLEKQLEQETKYDEEGNPLPIDPEMEAALNDFDLEMDKYKWSINEYENTNMAHNRWTLNSTSNIDSTDSETLNQELDDNLERLNKEREGDVEKYIHYKELYENQLKEGDPTKYYKDKEVDGEFGYLDPDTYKYKLGNLFGSTLSSWKSQAATLASGMMTSIGVGMSATGVGAVIGVPLAIAGVGLTMRFNQYARNEESYAELQENFDQKVTENLRKQGKYDEVLRRARIQLKEQSRSNNGVVELDGEEFNITHNDNGSVRFDPLEERKEKVVLTDE